MSKTNDTSNLDHDTLADTELDAVTGGMLYLGATNTIDAEMTKAIGLIAAALCPN